MIIVFQLYDVLRFDSTVVIYVLTTTTNFFLTTTNFFFEAQSA